MTCPIPPTVIPSIAEGETGASVVQVPCPYAACAAVKGPSAPDTIARNHFLRVQKRSNIFLSSFRSYWFVEKRALRPAHERQSEGKRARIGKPGHWLAFLRDGLVCFRVAGERSLAAKPGRAPLTPSKIQPSPARGAARAGTQSLP